MATHVDDVVRYIVRLGDLYDDGDSITNMKLQKLLYYFQGFHVAAFNSNALFEDSIEAWDHGPVVPPVWRQYTSLGRQPIRISELPGESQGDFSGDQLTLLNNVYDSYGQYTAWKLRQMTHQEIPWLAARDRGKRTGDYEITKDDLGNFFGTRLIRSS